MSERQPDAPETEELDDVAEDLGIDPAEAQTIFDDVERALTQLLAMDVDVDDVEDLDRIRDVLPTEPQRAAIIQAALPLPLRDALEYVRPSERQSGYWRRSRERRDPSQLSDRELVRRREFIDAAIDARGTEGSVTMPDGREIPRSARRMGEDLDGLDVDVDRDEGRRDRGKAILRRMRDWL